MPLPKILPNQGVTGRVRMLAAAVLLVAMVSGFLVTDGGDFGARFSSEKSRHDPTTEPDTVDTPTVEEARQMIVGTWIENTADKVDNLEKGPKKWVFTDDGTVRKYRNGELYAEQRYEIVQRYDEMQDPDEIIGYLKFTRPDGEVYYATLAGIQREEGSYPRPYLFVKHHGPGLSNTNFNPPGVFE